LEKQLDFIHIAPSPSFTRLEGLHHRMLGFVEVLCRMLVFRGVAAAYVSALETKAQMNPRVAGLQALFATLRRLRLYFVDVIEMRAGCHAHYFTPIAERIAPESYLQRPA
jgi:hypothetical protein